jgi:hypothetical protein
MPLSRLGDKQLYIDYFHYCDHFAAMLPAVASALAGPLVYHCFWHGTLTKHHELSLKSLLITQTGPFEVWLWMTPETLTANAAFLGGLDDAHLHVKPCDANQLTAMALDTPLEDQVGGLLKQRIEGISDAVRTLVLLKHGGIYFDLDVLFLKDLRCLAGVDFIYPWSNQPYGNSALAHFRQHSTNLHALATHAAATGSCHPRRLYHFATIDPLVDDLHVWPIFTFDPAWLANDTGVPLNAYSRNLRDFFTVEQPISIDTFYPASYAYHWHNGWNCDLTDHSIAGQLYRQVCDLYATSVRSGQSTLSAEQ